MQYKQTGALRWHQTFYTPYVADDDEVSILGQNHVFLDAIGWNKHLTVGVDVCVEAAKLIDCLIVACEAGGDADAGEQGLEVVEPDVRCRSRAVLPVAAPA